MCPKSFASIARILGPAATLIALALAAAPALPASREMPPETWEGLKLVKRPGLDTVYLREGATLAKYSRVMLDPVEVSFDKNWNTRRGPGLYDEADPQEIRQNLSK